MHPKNDAGSTERDGPKRALILVTAGPTEPDKTYAPFYIAALMGAMEIETTIYLLMHAPELAVRGAAERIPLKKGGTLRQFVDMALESGVQLLACTESVHDLCGLEESDLMPEVRVVGSATLADLALDADTVLSF
jgi:hypothetical protein